MLKQAKRLFIAIGISLYALSANATVIHSMLDQSNVLHDGNDYVSVQVKESHEGVLNFWVQPLEALSNHAGSNFGIQSFGFGFIDDIDISLDDLYRNISVPVGWKVQFDRQMGEAGKFNVRLMANGHRRHWKMDHHRHEKERHEKERHEKGRHNRHKKMGHNRRESLHFSVVGLDIDNISSFFAAHVAGFEIPGNGCEEHVSAISITEHGREGKNEGRHECEVYRSGFFHGETPSEIPLPAAIWLFAGGLLGLVSVARRSRA